MIEGHRPDAPSRHNETRNVTYGRTSFARAMLANARALRRHELPRALRRAVGLVRFARSVVGASDASMFLLEGETGVLRGLVSEWDWTRTSFTSHLRDWPTVAQALLEGSPRVLSRENALGTEAAWFEPRGIVATICVPVRDEGRPVGILFFDFDTDVGDVDLPFLVDIGERCSRAIARRSHRTPLVRRIAVGTTESSTRESSTGESSIRRTA